MTNKYLSNKNTKVQCLGAQILAQIRKCASAQVLAQGHKYTGAQADVKVRKVCKYLRSASTQVRKCVSAQVRK